MSLFNPEIHHRQSLRLKNHDYSKGSYFVTITMENIRCMFAVRNGAKLRLTEIGVVTEKFWQEIPEHFSSAILDEYVIMPDHVHGIVHLKQISEMENNGNGHVKFSGYDDNNVVGANEENIGVAGNNVGAKNFVGAGHVLPLPPVTLHHSIPNSTPNKTQDHKQHQFHHIIPDSIGSVIRSYKSAVTKWCNQNGCPQFKWQRNYFERIIRNEKELFTIRQYIKNNPVRGSHGS